MYTSLIVLLTDHHDCSYFPFAPINSATFFIFTTVNFSDNFLPCGFRTKFVSERYVFAAFCFSLFWLYPFSSFMSESSTSGSRSQYPGDDSRPAKLDIERRMSNMDINAVQDIVNVF